MPKRINIYLLIAFLLFMVALFIWFTYVPATHRETTSNLAKTNAFSIDQLGPQYGGVLSIGLNEALSFVNPIMAEKPFQHILVKQLYNRLCYLDDNGNVQGELLRAWESDSGKTSLTLILRKGVMFHNGPEVTTREIINAMDVYRLNHQFKEKYVFFSRIKGTKEINSYTLRVFFISSEVEGLKEFCQLPMFIFLKQTDEGSPAYPLGTGPFMVTDKAPGKKLSLRVNQDYFLGRPYLDQIIYQSESNENELLKKFHDNKYDQIILNDGKIMTQPYLRLVKEPKNIPEIWSQVWLAPIH